MNQLIGASVRETVENVEEALRGALVLMTDRLSDLALLLTPVLEALEGRSHDLNAREVAAGAFNTAILRMAEKHSDLCKLLMPVLDALDDTLISQHSVCKAGALPTELTTRNHVPQSVNSL